MEVRDQEVQDIHLKRLKEEMVMIVQLLSEELLTHPLEVVEVVQDKNHLHQEVQEQ